MIKKSVPGGRCGDVEASSMEFHFCSWLGHFTRFAAWRPTRPKRAVVVMQMFRKCAGPVTRTLLQVYLLTPMPRIQLKQGIQSSAVFSEAPTANVEHHRALVVTTNDHTSSGVIGAGVII